MAARHAHSIALRRWTDRDTLVLLRSKGREKMEKEKRWRFTDSDLWEGMTLADRLR